jgi:hypothetical protein
VIVQEDLGRPQDRVVELVHVGEANLLNPTLAEADESRMRPVLGEETRIIRPAAVLDQRTASRVLQELERLDVACGGVWNATSSLWQRYDQPWDGLGGSRGSAQLIGSIAVMYDSPNRHQITIYKVTVSAYGLRLGWTVDSLCDDALSWVGLSLESCPRAELAQPPVNDPFKRSAAH